MLNSDYFALLYITENNCEVKGHMTSYFLVYKFKFGQWDMHPSQCFIELFFSAITAARLLGSVSMHMKRKSHILFMKGPKCRVL